MAVKTLYFFRHGQTDWNLKGIVQGSGNDIPLNPTGQEQARTLAGQLEGTGIEHIYTSDLQRARDTARTVADVLNIGLSLTPDLREIDFGEAEGLTREEVRMKYAHIYREIDSPEMAFYPTARMPGGESRQDVLDRVMAYLLHVVAPDCHNTIGVSTHAGVMHTLSLQLFGEMRPFPNCAVLQLQFDTQRREFYEVVSEDYSCRMNVEE